MKTNLLFHVYGDEALYCNEQINYILNQSKWFDNIVFKVVYTDINKAKYFFDQLIGERIKVVYYPNNPIEVDLPGFCEEMDKLIQEDGFTLYGHTKGASVTSNEFKKAWGKALLELNLCNIPLVRKKLSQEYYSYGSLLIRHPAIKENIYCPFHYTGTYWWVRNDILRNSKWKTLEKSKHYSEFLLSQLFDISKAGCFFELPWINNDYLDLNYNKLDINQIKERIIRSYKEI